MHTIGPGLVCSNMQYHLINLCYAVIFFIQGTAYADQIVQLAWEPPSVYTALHKVLTMMEAGKLKGQKEGSGNEGKIHHYKVLQLDFQQYQLLPRHGGNWCYP